MRRRSVVALMAGVSLGGSLYLVFSTASNRLGSGQTGATTTQTIITTSAAETTATTSSATPRQTTTTPAQTQQTTTEATQIRWIVEEPLPTSLTEVAMVADASSLYLAGGLTADGDASARFFAYDVSSRRWRELSPMPAALHHVGLAYLDGVVYLLGGYDRGWRAQRNVYGYSVKRDSWEELTPMPAARGAFTAQAVKGVVYAVGGARNSVPLNANEAYSPSSNEWASRPSMRIAREHLASGVVGGKLYVVGGRVVSGNTMTNLDVVEEYDVESGVWRTRRPMPTARSGLAAAVVEGRVYVCGGESQVKTFSEVEAYDPVSDRWAKVADLPTPR
ncbi:MAG: kelch repeat-containing protein, partial [Candidatus Caldarchaeum sp.]